ncbi:hypothetical protein [Azospirillum argentinense]
MNKKDNEAAMGNVIKFPVKRAVSGSIYCKDIGVHFPKLYRAQVNLTMEHILDFGASAEVASSEVGTHIYYGLDPNQLFAGDGSWQAAASISEGDGWESIVIRHHSNHDKAKSYLDSLGDGFIGATEDEYDYTSHLFQTDDGIFTFRTIPTRPEWIGPLLIYIADIPANNPFGWDIWATIIGPNGEHLNPKDFGL